MSGTLVADTIVAMRGTVETAQTPCASANPELWFAEQPTELSRAKALCAGCPIKDACLAGALDRREPWGVWGGEIVDQGVVLAYKRGRGRPSNTDRRLGLVTVTASGQRRPSASRRRSAATRAATAAAVVTTSGTAETFRSQSA